MAAWLDLAILAWLVGTWFFEGHHRRCTVVVRCSSCGRATDHTCMTKVP